MKEPTPCDTLNEGPMVKSARHALDTIVGNVCLLARLDSTPERARQMGYLAQAGNFLLAYLSK